MSTQYYYVWGECLGSRPAPLVEVTRGGHQWPMSYALVCPRCGKLWAQIECDAGGSAAPWSPIAATCNLCGGGSFLLRWLPVCGLDVPLSALHHEFTYALAHYERTQNELRERNDPGRGDPR